MYKRTDPVVAEWEFWVLYHVFVTDSVSRFVANLRIGRISSNLKKKSVFLCGHNLRVGKIG